MYRDIFLKQIYKPSLSTNTPFIVDCGANIGISVLYFKYLYPEGEVWAFEPNPHSFYLLEKNIKENNIIGVKLYNCALGNMEEQIVFYVPINKSSLNGGSYISFEKSNIVHVQCQRLSQIVKGKKIDLIKIDIEGDETNVIEDLDQQHTLKYASEYVMEYHFKPTRTSKDFSDFITLFEKNGFVCELNYNEEIEINKQDILVRAKRRQYLP